MKAFPQFLGPIKCLNGSGFRYGTGLVPSFNFPERFVGESGVVVLSAPAEWAERMIPSLWPLQEPICFWEAPSVVGASCHFLPEDSP